MRPLGEFDKFDNDYTIKESEELGIGVLWIKDLLYIWRPTLADAVGKIRIRVPN
jgi:hypothetical protein